MSKGKGEGHHFARMTEEQARLALRLLQQRDVAIKLMEGLTYEAIGRRCGVGKNAIFHLAKGNSWGHLKEPGGGVN